MTMVCVDLEKAFDNANWEMLWSVYTKRGLGFGGVWRRH